MKKVVRVLDLLVLAYIFIMLSASVFVEHTKLSFDMPWWTLWIAARVLMYITTIDGEDKEN